MQCQCHDPPTSLFCNVHRYIEREIVLTVHLYQDLKLGEKTS